jgi:cytosine permease
MTPLLQTVGRLFTRLVERSPARRVTRDDQRSWFFLAAIQIGISICLPLFALGGQLGMHARYLDLIPAVIVGALLAAVFATLTGVVGLRARVPTAMLMRRAFGVTGGKVVSAVLILTLFGWFGVQTEMLVDSVRTLLLSNLGLSVSRLPVTVMCGALMTSTAVIGFRALGKIAYVAVPLLLAVISVPTWIALTTHAVRPLLFAPAAQTPYSFGIIVSIISGGHMVAVTVAPDLTRFLRSPRDAVIGMGVSLGFTLPVLLLLSALLAVVYGDASLIAVLVAAGAGVPALLVIILATWTCNDKSLYEAALSLSVLFPNYERWCLTAVAGAIGTALAAAGIFEHFIQVLLFMGVTIAPIAGVYLVDFHRNRAGYLEQHVAQAAVRWESCLAWACGVALGALTLPRASQGLGILQLTGIPTLDALLGAAATQSLVLMLSARTAARQTPLPER